MKPAATTTVLATAVLLAAPAIASAAEGGAGLPPAINEGLITAITALVVFLLLLAILTKTAWGPIAKGLAAREAKIRDDIETAEKARAEAIAKLEDYKRQIAGADAEVREKLAAATKDAEAIATRLKMQAQQEAEEAKARATKEIDEARKAAIADVQNQAASIGTLIASKILKRSINEQDQADLVRASLEEMGRK